jgi:hypothetical protein
MLEKIDVRIVRTDTREKTNLDDIDVFENWEWNFDQVKITLNSEPIKSLDELSKRLKQLRADTPPPPPGEEDDLKMNLEPMKGVIYEDVVKIVDVALDARFTSITFRGIEMDA